MLNNLCKLVTIFCTLLSFQLHAMTTDGDQIINSKGEAIVLKGVNWFGFNNQSTMVDGLWGGPESQSFDFANMVYKLQLLGFNAVRLPFSFKDLYNLPPRNYAQNCVLSSQKTIQDNLTNPSVPVPEGKTIPPMIAPPARNPGRCDDYFPNDTTLNRFLWVINFFAKNGFYVLIDNHMREDQTVLQDQEQWVQDWVRLATAIAKDPISKDKIMIDILNEPDNFGVRWEGNRNVPGLKDLYISAMDALYPINPSMLFFIEGGGQSGISANWGDGFATDKAVIQQNGLSDPNPFFQILMDKPYVNQVVISPHVYPPSVTGGSPNSTGAGLWNRLSTSFGYFTQKGYCKDSVCKRFPVAIGEFGSRFTEAADLQSMSDIALYLNNKGEAADGKHRAIPNWFYWSWNANSGDTGGIVEDNWTDIVWKKIDYLSTLNLRPWYLKPAEDIKYGTLCISVAPTIGLGRENLLPIASGSYSFEITDFDESICRKLPVGDYTFSAPDITLENIQFKAQPETVAVFENQTSSLELVYEGTSIEVPTSTYTVSVQLGTPWQENPNSRVYKNVLHVYVKNTGKTALKAPWNLTIANDSYRAVESSWNLDKVSIQNGTIKAVAPHDWQSLEPNEAREISVGMIIASDSNNFMPTKVTINGAPVKATLKP